MSKITPNDDWYKKNLSARTGTKYGESLTLGKKVSADANTGGVNDFAGRYMGDGTVANSGSFNTKESIVLTEYVAAVLNTNMENMIEKYKLYSYGLYFLSKDEKIVPFFTNLSIYYEDIRARIFINNEIYGTSIYKVIPPSSDFHYRAMTGDLQVGGVRIRNPLTEGKHTGYVAPGSTGWKNIMKQIFSRMGNPAVEYKFINHFVSQTFVYMFPEIARDNKIEVFLNNNNLDSFDNRLIPLYDFSINNIEDNKGKWEYLKNSFDAIFIRMKDEYNAFKSTVDKKIGIYGWAGSIPKLKHMWDVSDSQINELVTNFNWRDGVNGNYKNLYKFKPTFKDVDNRINNFAFPVRNAEGEVLRNAHDPDGTCPPVAWGPRITQNALANNVGDYGMQAVAKVNRKNVRGERTGTSFHCKSISDVRSNPNRRLYKPGHKLGGKLGLEKVLELRGDKAHTYKGLEELYKDSIKKRKGIYERAKNDPDYYEYMDIPPMFIGDNGRVLGSKHGISTNADIDTTTTPNYNQLKMFKSNKKALTPGVSLTGHQPEWYSRALLAKGGESKEEVKKGEEMDQK